MEVSGRRSLFGQRETADRRYSVPALLLLIVLALLPVAWAQEAGLVGTVSDSSGAVMSAVTVTAHNVDTGVERHVATDEQGRFSIRRWPSGNTR